MSKNNELIRLGELRDWQAELPFLDWGEDGELCYNIDDSGELCFPVKVNAELPDGVGEQLTSSSQIVCGKQIEHPLLPLDAPALKDRQAFQQAKLNEEFAEIRRTFNDLHDFISDPDNEQPIPLHILRDRPEMAAWLNGENPRYMPTVVEYKVIWPAFLERRRKIKERGLAGNSKLDAILALLENRMETQAVVDGIPTEHRTKPITLKKAAQALGKSNDKTGAEWVKRCMGDGTISSEMKTRQNYVFDTRQFPEEKHYLIK